jgi:2-amino-4-hydroxy-6-hydroxymethyldihydropteridine diphosphokinase
MVPVYLGLGSNLGDREATLCQALERLEGGVEVARVSSLYETEPVGVVAQPWFLNLVCEGWTELPPGELLQFIRDVEDGLGRVREQRFGPRTVDIDILLYGELIMETPRLRIPHPRLHQRAFVLIPLAELAPELTHPLLGLTIGQLLERLEKPEEVRCYTSRAGSAA